MEVNEDVTQSCVNTYNSAANGELKEIVEMERATEVQNIESI